MSRTPKKSIKIYIVRGVVNYEVGFHMETNLEAFTNLILANQYMEELVKEKEEKKKSDKYYSGYDSFEIEELDLWS